MKRILILLTLLLSFTIHAAPVGKSNFIIIIDAGSSGTRLHIYQYNKNKTLHLSQIAKQETRPGLASFSKNPQKAAASFQTLLNGAKKFLHKHYNGVTTTRLYLFATGGMRALPMLSQRAIYQVITPILKKSGFIIKNIKTISGQEEAAFAWLSANYPDIKKDVTHKTHPILDLGGASTQIAFFDSAGQQRYPTIVKLDDKKFPLFTKSFLELGIDKAIHSIEERHCYPTGFKNKKIRRAKFNYENCHKTIQKFLAPYHISEQLPPLPTEQPFHLFSEYYYAMHFFDADNLSKLKKAVIHTCEHKNWGQLQKDYPLIDKHYLREYCFAGTYILVLLNSEEGYRLPLDTRFTVSSDTTNISWALGAALYSLQRD